MLKGSIKIRRKVESEIDHILIFVDQVLSSSEVFKLINARNIIKEMKKEHFDFFDDDVESMVIDDLRKYCSEEIDIKELCSNLEIFKKELIEFKKKLLLL